ncbi:MAG: nucleotidyltransferase family protein [Acidobacteria bacterium]|nr:nucleotidyltransferase family protein [Acidobacteriota bacterium]
MSEPPNIAAVILAAGASSRMGRPKALLEFEGATLLDRQILLFSGVCRKVVCVLGYAVEEVAAGARRAAEAVVVLNPRPERGQLSSLQSGLRAVEGSDAVFFLPVDGPGVHAETLQRLIAEWGNAEVKPPFTIPQHAGRHGHPVLMDGSWVAAMLALPAEASARELVRAQAERNRYVEVEDERVATDVDTPAEYEMLVKGVRF